MNLRQYHVHLKYTASHVKYNAKQLGEKNQTVDIRGFYKETDREVNENIEIKRYSKSVELKRKFENESKMKKMCTKNV